MRVLKVATASKACIVPLKIIFILPLKLILWVLGLILYPFTRKHKKQERIEIVEEDEPIPQIQEIPEFQEIFNVTRDTIIGIEYIERIPDETAFIRVIGEFGFTKQFKKKVCKDAGYNGNRYIKVDNIKYYLEKSTARNL